MNRCVHEIIKSTDCKGRVLRDTRYKNTNVIASSTIFINIFQFLLLKIYYSNYF